MVNLILRTVFSDLIDRAGEQVQNAIATGDSALAERMIQAEQSLTSLIDYGSQAYKNLLDYTITQVSPEVQNFVNQLETLVNDVITQEETVLQSIVTKVQQIASTLPLANLKPQVFAIRPRYFVIDDSSPNSLVTFEGNFVWPQVGGPVCSWYGYCNPTLQMGNTTCALQDQTTQKLSFLFPNTIFGNRTNDKEFYRAKGELKVPFEESPGLLLGAVIGQVTNFFTYHITLVALPRIAGSGIATFSSQMQQREVGTYQQAQDFAGNGITVTRQFLPNPGFQFVVNTVKGEFLNYYNLGQVITDNKPHCITVSIHCARGVGKGGGPGHARFQITCDQEKFTTVKNLPREERFELTWNTDRVFTPRNGEKFFGLTFNDCRGRLYNFHSAEDQDNLRFRAAPNDVWKLKAEKPTDLDFAYPLQ
jgi:hypothetical protein